jgi:Ion transport protein
MTEMQGCYVQVVELDELERIQVYKDECPLLGFRKKIWVVKATINYIAFTIIKHPLFESCTIIVIVINSLFLAMENPKIEVQSEMIQDGEIIFLVIYTIEMSLKILALGFVFGRGAYLTS